MEVVECGWGKRKEKKNCKDEPKASLCLVNLDHIRYRGATAALGSTEKKGGSLRRKCGRRRIFSDEYRLFALFFCTIFR